MPSKKKNVHKTGALAAVLDSLEPATIESFVEEDAPHSSQSKTHHQDIDTYLRPKTKTSSETRVVEINPKDANNWSFSDRPETELGDIEALAQDILENGQQQPCIVRTVNNKTYQYEIIAGERRWRATLKANLPLKVIIKDIDDIRAALIQASENANRRDLSDYAKGMNYAKLIQWKILSQKELQSKLHLSKAAISNLLAFAAIPNSVIEAISDLSKVSAKTASLIRAYSNKGDDYIHALISIADKIANGMGEKTLVSLMDRLLAVDNSKPSINKAYSFKDGDGNTLFTILHKNKNIKINLSTAIDKELDLEELGKTLNQHLFS